MNEMPLASLYNRSELTAYASQFGLQGKIFRHLARHMDYDKVLSNLQLLCALITAFVFSIIVILISLKYNSILAGVFLFTFWLSPWIINFARNLYWVEFTWFIPMAAGLFCAYQIENSRCRIASYIITFFSIVGKCLCGYEYVSTIMMALIAFLLIDLTTAILKKDKKGALLLFRTIIIIGMIALIGFVTALCIHASLRGNGNIFEGVKIIFEQDILRRTTGADLNEFDSGLWPSFNASVWETFCKYFHFNTEIITGLNGNLFPLLCIIPLCILGYGYKVKKPDIELTSMYVVFFLASISWFCLAKGHSYVHTHMNYVLWYFGFVQTCLYIIINSVVKLYFICTHARKE